MLFELQRAIDIENLENRTEKEQVSETTCKLHLHIQKMNSTALRGALSTRPVKPRTQIHKRGKSHSPRKNSGLEIYVRDKFPVNIFSGYNYFVFAILIMSNIIISFLLTTNNVSEKFKRSLQLW